MKNIEKLFTKEFKHDYYFKKNGSSNDFSLPRGIILVVDKDNKLLGTITDGDIRRAFKNKNKVLLAQDIMNNNPLTFPHDVKHKDIIAELPKKLKTRKNSSRKFAFQFEL